MGHPGVAVLVDQGSHAFLIINTSRDENLKIVGERDQPSIEHPVCRAGKRETIAHDIRPILLDRSDMRCVDLGTTATVYQPEARNRASLSIGSQDRSTEEPVPYGAR